MCDIKGCKRKPFYKFENLNLSICFDCFVELQSGILEQNYNVIEKGDF